MDEVIQNFQVLNILVTNSSHSTQRFTSLLRLIQKKNIRVLNPDAQGRTLTLGSIAVIVFPLKTTYFGNENDNSIGLRVVHGDVSSFGANTTHGELAVSLRLPLNRPR